MAKGLDRHSEVVIRCRDMLIKKVINFLMNTNLIKLNKGSG